MSELAQLLLHDSIIDSLARNINSMCHSQGSMKTVRTFVEMTVGKRDIHLQMCERLIYFSLNDIIESETTQFCKCLFGLYPGALPNEAQQYALSLRGDFESTKGSFGETSVYYGFKHTRDLNDALDLPNDEPRRLTLFTRVYDKLENKGILQGIFIAVLTEFLLKSLMHVNKERYKQDLFRRALRHIRNKP